MNGRLIILLIGTHPMLTVAQTGDDAFKLNQCGFYPNSQKVAVLTDASTESKFYIASANGKEIYFTGELSEQRESAYSGF